MIDFKVCRKEMEWGGRKLVLETGKIARQATGAVVVKYGETEVLATVCAAKEAKADQDFFPLTVNYQEKYYATGKVPGGFMKREGKPSEREVLISRLIDRPIRPFFQKRRSGYLYRFVSRSEQRFRHSGHDCRFRRFDNFRHSVFRADCRLQSRL